jgi:hypothetical protein
MIPPTTALNNTPIAKPVIMVESSMDDDESMVVVSVAVDAATVGVAVTTGVVVVAGVRTGVFVAAALAGLFQ